MADMTIGNIVKGQVTGIEKYGAFISLDNGCTGLVHISEVSNDFVKDIGEFLSIGEIIYCQVLEIDEKDNKYKLSIKNINYKSSNDGKIKESRLGFLPLKINIDKWIANKISEIKK